MGTSDGEAVLRARFESRTGRPLDLDNPLTFTEKVYWRMIALHRRPDQHLTLLADKYRVRDYVAARVGADTLTPLLWHGTDPAAIPWLQLPQRYVIKTNHGCSHVIRVSGAPDTSGISSNLSVWLRTNFYWTAREIQYLRISPRIMIESYLQDGYADGPLDYRFFCFDGEPLAIQVDDHSHAIHRFFDPSWRSLDYSYRDASHDYPISRPTDLAVMLDVASELSRGLDFVRVDLYQTTEGVKVGELTLTPTGGFLLPFRQEEAESRLGHAWDLPGPLPPRPRRWSQYAR
jgi:hypothetical protein